MPVNVDRLGRMINNLYTRVFEQGSKTVGQNAAFRYAQTNTEPAVGASGDAGWVREIQRDSPLVFARLQDDYENWWTTSAVGTKPLNNLGSLALTGNFADYSGLSKPVGNSIDGATNDSGVLKFDYLASTANYITMAYRAWQVLSLEMVINNVVANSSELSLLKIVNNAGAYCELRITTAGALKVDFNNLESVTYGSGLLTGRHHIGWVIKSMNDVNWLAISLYVDGTEVLDYYRPTNTWAPSALGTDTYTFLQQSSGTGGKSIEVDEIVVFGTQITATRMAQHAAAILNRSSTYPTAAVESYVAPVPRYYTTLTQAAGSNYSRDTSGWGFSNGSAVSTRVTYPLGGVGNTTKMWGVFRVTCDFAYNDTAAAVAGLLMNWDDGSNSYIKLEYQNTNPGLWSFYRFASGVGGQANATANHFKFEGETVAFWCTSTQICVGKSGVFGTPVANTSIPSLSTIDMEFGGSSKYATANAAFGQNIGGSIQWIVLGTGDITNTEFAALHAMGSEDPQLFDIPNILTLDVSFLWHCKSLEHVPIGVWGESNYG